MSPYATDSGDRSRERGLSTIPVLAMIILMMAVGSSALLTGKSNHDRAELQANATKALAVADAGIARAILELNRDEDLDKCGTIGDAAGDFAEGTFDVTATKIEDGRYMLFGVGIVNDVRRHVETVVQAGPGSHRWVYANGFVSLGDIDMKGDLSLDSYDSAAGSYASQATNSDGLGTFAGEKGILTANGAISGGNKVVIRGDIHPGPGEIFYPGGAHHNGVESSLQEPVVLPPPAKAEFDAAYANNRNGDIVGNKVSYDPDTKALSVKGVATFPPGNYFFSSIKFNGQATIVLSGETKFYITGDVDLSGGAIVNSTELARNFEIIAYPYEYDGVTPPTSPEIKLTGGSQSAMAVYAPEHYAKIRSDKGEVYGAIAAKQLDLQGMSLHYDTSLASNPPSTPGNGGTGGNFVAVRWRDASPALY